MIQIKRSPLWIALLALITIMSLFGAFLHHHDDAHAHECPVCRLVQIISAALLFTAVFLLIQLVKTQSFVLSIQETFQSLLLTVSLKDRAPPVFSF